MPWPWLSACGCRSPGRLVGRRPARAAAARPVPLVDIAGRSAPRARARGRRSRTGRPPPPTYRVVVAARSRSRAVRAGRPTAAPAASPRARPRRPAGSPGGAAPLLDQGRRGELSRFVREVAAGDGDRPLSGDVVARRGRGRGVLDVPLLGGRGVVRELPVSWPCGRVFGSGHCAPSAGTAQLPVAAGSAPSPGGVAVSAAARSRGRARRAGCRRRPGGRRCPLRGASRRRSRRRRSRPGAAGPSGRRCRGACPLRAGRRSRQCPPQCSSGQRGDGAPQMQYGGRKRWHEPSSAGAGSGMQAAATYSPKAASASGTMARLPSQSISRATHCSASRGRSGIGAMAPTAQRTPRRAGSRTSATEAMARPGSGAAGGLEEDLRGVQQRHAHVADAVRRRAACPCRPAGATRGSRGGLRPGPR